MRTFSALLLFFAGAMAGSSYAQNWIVFVPVERDFRALFPAPPERSTEGDGSIAFKANVVDAEYTVEYVVYRLPPNVPRVVDARAEIERRLGARIGNEDVALRYLSEDEGDPGWERYVFRHGQFLSVHRLVENRGRYYELEVAMPRGAAPVAMNTARDFFNSFQMTGVVPPPFGIAGQQKLEAWCQNRTDSFSRAFCQYSVCLQPGYENYPHCATLFRR